LAAFLIRGGFLLVLAPIVVLPTAIELGNLLAPVITTVAFRGVTPTIAVLAVAGGLAFLFWLVGGGLLAAAAEVELVRRVGADEDIRPARGHPRDRAASHPTVGVLLARLAALLPLLLLALPWSSYRVVLVGYHELTSPTTGGLPLAVRIALGAPDAVALLIVTWVLAELAGGLAARRVITAGDGVRAALGWAMRRLVTRPGRSVALGVATLVPLTAVLILAGAAGTTSWDALRAALAAGGDPPIGMVLVVVLVALFGGGLLLVGVVSAWRGAVWTVEVAGTFGAMAHGPEGQWNGAVDSGTLADLRPRGVDPDTR
ncbi:MAG TPA: hypothetical protein VM408_05365, partial [Methylomirabilota bacterium]|nr:hypothetical protein [Methylomirabilota bacterium]